MLRRLQLGKLFSPLLVAEVSYDASMHFIPESVLSSRMLWPLFFNSSGCGGGQAAAVLHEPCQANYTRNGDRGRSVLMLLQSGKPWAQLG